MSRIEKIVQALPGYEIDGMLITGPVNRRWATGFHSSAGALLVTAEKSYFITDSRYIEAARAKIKGAEIIQMQIGQEYPVMIAELAASHGLTRLGFEQDFMTQGAYTKYQEKLQAELVPAQKLISTLRQSKDAEEYALIQKAQEITDLTFSQVLGLISPKITEQELQAEIVYRLLKNGADKPAFDPIVVSGPRSSMPHGVAGDYLLSGFLTLDFGAVYQGYASDMTRTVAIGSASKEMREVYDTVLKAQLAGIAAARAGVVGKEIDKAARQVIQEAGYGDYFNHGFGHGLGLEVHESPNASSLEEAVLPVGAVISAEPGIYLPGEFGVRIEDLLYLTESGSENLTKSAKELIIL